MVIDDPDVEYVALTLILALPQSWVFLLISTKDMKTEFLVEDSILLHDPAGGHCKQHPQAAEERLDSSP